MEQRRADILFAFGTRPEAIKLAPLIQMAKKTYHVRCCVTGQHREMLHQVLDVFGIVPDDDLDLMSEDQDTADLLARMEVDLRRIYRNARPHWVFVHGDTTTAVAAAQAAAREGIPVAHVEAGLRTGDLQAPFPEELHRRWIGRIAALHFAPTERAKQNLMAEGVSPDRIGVTGNTVIDALALASAAIGSKRVITRFPFLRPDRHLILVTAHRRENRNARLFEICEALATLAARSDIQIVFPVHPNPRVRRPVHERLSGQDNIHLLNPVAYLDFVGLMKASTLILTDSGGIQEEAPALGKPVLVLREVSERPEGVEAGTAELVGCHRHEIVTAVHRILGDPALLAERSRASQAYGDGRASERILRLFERFRLEQIQPETVARDCVGPSFGISTMNSAPASGALSTRI